VVRPPSVPHVERRVLAVEEAQRFLQLVEGDRLEAFFVIAMTLGLRRGEVLGLKWSDIDGGTRTLRVARAVQRSGGELRVMEPKTARSRRQLPLPAMTLTALERHRARQMADRLKAGPGWQDLGFVFTIGIGTPLEPRNVNRRFHELRAQAGLDWLRLHDLRHGCATFLLAHGVEPRTVMEVLGHSTYRLTMDLYGHALPERMFCPALSGPRRAGFRRVVQVCGTVRRPEPSHVSEPGRSAARSGPWPTGLGGSRVSGRCQGLSGGGGWYSSRRASSFHSSSGS